MSKFISLFFCLILGSIWSLRGDNRTDKCVQCASLENGLIASNSNDLVTAYNLAVNTLKINTRRGVISAGAQYGSEWTRDIAINVWNGLPYLNPSVAKRSLWSVVDSSLVVKHQYWDKIIWVSGAWSYFTATNDTVFLQKAYTCSVNTMSELEQTTFDATDNLFMGPSVFNDGISGYDEPVYQPGVGSSYVLDYPNARKIKSLSTNCIYLLAYQKMNEMHKVLFNREDAHLLSLTKKLKQAIRLHFWNSQTASLAYFIDHLGHVHTQQEGIGIAFAILADVVSTDEASLLVSKMWSSPYGIPSIYPSFKRFSLEKPGRHNVLIWPVVNGFFSQALAKIGAHRMFDREFFGLIQLALDEDKGDYDFYEIYNPSDGHTFGGWQVGHVWDSCLHQSWSASSFLSMVYYGIIGLDFSSNGLTLHPYLPEGIHHVELTDLLIDQCRVSIELIGTGGCIRSILINNEEASTVDLSLPLNEDIRIQMVLSKGLK